MTEFEKALAQAKKFAEKNENQITETEFETLTDSYKIEPDELINLRAELENSGVKINDPDLDNDDTDLDSDGEDANVVDDSVKMYLKEIGKIELLDAEQEKDIAQRMAKGDEEAKELLINSNLRLVVSIAKKYKVSDFVIGAAIIGVGTSMPEMTVSFLGALNGNADVAIGNIVGSNIFNIALILGLCSQVSQLTSTGIGIIDLLVMIAAVLVLFLFSKDCKISRAEGAILFLCFVAYNWYLISNQIA